ncbi:MAG: Nif3-like dinuclear metal center hexameric protein [Treponema sp.]|nr:Nif3-like dinuclear metal center hexameric protein [Treponema sp.]
MTVKELHEFFNAFLKLEDFPGDPSLNGIQIQNSGLETKEIKKIAFAVDACQQTALKAAEMGADALVVHHGLFWGHCERVTGVHYKRIKAFLDNDLALLAYHIPLDANNPYGNNFGLAKLMGLKEAEGFGSWRGMPIGVKAKLEKPLTAEEVAKLLSTVTKTECRAFPFGKEKITSIGIISGGASEDVDQAAAEGLDAYITGEFAHEQYHTAEEMGINVISGGHYGTEIIGVSLLKKKVEEELGLESCFIDIPTGL